MDDATELKKKLVKDSKKSKKIILVSMKKSFGPKRGFRFKSWKNQRAGES